MPAGFKSFLPYLKVVDVVLEVADARLPVSSRFSGLNKILQGKARILVLTRCDLADPAATAEWLQKFKKEGITAVAVDARRGEGIATLQRHLASMAGEKKLKLAARGLKMRALRLMIVGIPNVGKSSLLNRLVGRGAARTGDRPGITRGPQWVRLGNELEILDTPGVIGKGREEGGGLLWLGAIGCIAESSLMATDIANVILQFLLTVAPERLQDRYGITKEEMENADLLESIGRRRGFLLAGKKIDRERTAMAVINDFREGQLGRYTLERP